jgi:alpha-amylase/alpha-mannosidase (GH57 family)
MPATRKASPATVPPQRYLCVHGHFYQPPRENPWLETIELQDSAAPYHDWNERITSECYAPNGASRIVDRNRQIIRIVNNYARMSFNFGPTLLSWLKDLAPRTYRMIQDADQTSASLYSNHGSALAQVYNHIIMPLASERDARTQIRWGIADFEHRFSRKPEGMWLAETAVSRTTLDLLAQERIQFTILAPHQCARIRPIPKEPGDPSSPTASSSAKVGGTTTNPPDVSFEGAGLQPRHSSAQKDGALAPEGTPPWHETPNATVDTTRPYLVRLPNNRSIAVFFYDGPTSRAIAFEGLLNDGETFARRLTSSFDPNKPASEPQLVHVATDGESYGHHHKHGEMALSYALNWIKDNNLAQLTNYAEFLEKFPPQYEAEIAENTSWSCAHGIERWRSDCGCNGGHAGWNQRWRTPLREALDLLRDRTAPLAEAVAAPLLKDLWAARDAYIHVILDRSSDNLDRFFAAHATHTLTPAERITVFELLELQRHTQLMYTSCGWFFDDIAGIETIQIIAYAGRVIQLARKLFANPPLFGESAATLEADFLEILSRAQSNDPTMGNGADVYRRFVNAGRLDLESVGAHYAISSMFRSYPDAGNIFCFDVQRHSYDIMTSGRGRFAVGRATLCSRITEECEDICFAVLHLGDQNLSAAVKRYNPSAENNKNSVILSEASRGFMREAQPKDPPPGGHADAAQPLSANTPSFEGNTSGFEGQPPSFEGAGLQPRRQNNQKEGALAPEGISPNAAAWETFITNARNAIRHANLPELIRHIDAYFGNTLYSLTSLFADEQHRILQSILTQTLSEVEGSLIRIYEEHSTLLDFLSEAKVAAPPAFAVTAGFAINASLRRALEADTFDSAEIARLLRRSEVDHITLDNDLLSYTADKRMKRAMVSLEAALEQQGSAQQSPQNLSVLNETLAIAESLRTLPMEINLWQAQNIWNDLLRRSDETYWPREWRDGFRKVGLALNISVDDLVIDQGVRAF